jgi:hypothetical protein
VIDCHLSAIVKAKIVFSIIDECLNSRFDNAEEKYEKVLLFVSDGAQYMLKTGKLLKERYTNMLHVACIAHALNRICEFIRNKFPDVDKLISTCKKKFLKSSQCSFV